MTHPARRSFVTSSPVYPSVGRVLVPGLVPALRVVLLGAVVTSLAACPAAPPPTEKTPAAAEGTGGEKTPPTEGKAGEGETGGAAAPTPAGGTGEAAPAAGGTTGGTTGAPAAATDGAPAAADGGAEGADAGDTGGTAGDTGGPVDEITPLLDEAKKKKTSDAKATQLLDDAKAKGAAPTDVAKAANARGVALMGEPERAKPFFEYAMAADEKYPDAPFNLAKIAANEGDIDRVKELLAEVKARGGKKLLKTVGFDPTFALVAGEPDVEKLLK